MTMGIYLLKFKGTDYVYIGQSVDVEDRYKAHLSSMTCGTCTYKLHAAYILFNKPELVLLEECGFEELDSKEKYYIEKYNSTVTGLNILTETICKKSIKGYIPSTSKYSEEVYFNILICLINNYTLSNRDIASRTNTDITTVNNMRKLGYYKWLKTRYPEEYKILEDLYENPPIKPLQPKPTEYYPSIVSPTGEVFTIPYGKASEFAKTNKIIRSQLRGLFSGHIPQVLGWTLHNAAPKQV